MIKNLLIILISIIAVVNTEKLSQNSNKLFEGLNPNDFFTVLNDRSLAKNKTQYLTCLNESVNSILSITSDEGTVYLWDLLKPKLRISFLRKIGFNLTVNQSLSWSSLPLDTQASLLNLKFEPAKSKSKSNKNSTDESTAILALVRFDLMIDLNLLNEKVCALVADLTRKMVERSQNEVYYKESKYKRETLTQQ